MSDNFIWNGSNSKYQFNLLKANLDLISGVVPITIFSFKEDVTSQVRTIWPVPGTIQPRYIIKYTENNLIIESTSDEDTYLTGTGIWTLKVSGLNGNYEFIQEVVEMNGTAGVTTINKFLAVNQMNPELSGVAFTAVGNISALHGSDILAYICNVCPLNITTQSVFTVPKDTTLKINFFNQSPGAGDQIRCIMYVTNPINKIPIAQTITFSYQVPTTPLPLRQWITVPEKHTLEVVASSIAATQRQLSVNIGSDLIINSEIDPSIFVG